MSDEADGYHSAHYVKTSEDAAAVGINAGLDQEGGGNGATSHLEEAIAHKKTTAAHVTAAFRRLFRVRIKLGMLDPPVGPSVDEWNTIHYNTTELATNAAHLAVAKRAAREAMCLYKNADVKTGPGAGAGAAVTAALPLSAKAFSKPGSSLAVIGPAANVSFLPFYYLVGTVELCLLSIKYQLVLDSRQ